MAKQGADGRFVGGEDFVPGLPMEAFMNTKHRDILLGSAGAVVATEVETGLSIENAGDQAPKGLKWVLFGGIYQPADLATLVKLEDSAVVSSLMVQLQRGQEAAMRPRSDDEVIGQGMVILSGTRLMDWPKPLDILHPTPVLSRYLTILLDASDDATMDASRWNVQLFFGFSAMTDADDRALRQRSL